MTRLTRYHALTLMVMALLVAAVLRLPDLTAVPPGVHYDEAAYGLNAGDIGLRGDRPVFIPSFTGREPLFLYAAGGMAAALGNTLFALRLTAAFFGLLTVAATYWLGREMLADRRIALLAASLLAVSFWHVLFSRLGFRVISQPLLMALGLAALFRGLRGGRWSWLWLAGVLIGLTAYTYLAARLFPILLAFALLPLLFDSDSRRTRIRQLLFAGLVALLTALPLLAYFALHPDAFWVRIGQVAPGAESISLSTSLLRAFGMLFLRGDPYLRFNLPQRPLFDFVTGGLLVVGWLVCLLRYRRLPYDWQRASVLLLLLAVPVMLLPTALAVNEIVPSNLRALGLIPFVFFLPPIGLITLLRDVERHFHRPNLTAAVQVTVLLILWAGGQWTQHLYFRVWAADEELIFVNDGDMTAMAAYLDRTLEALPETERPRVFVASPHYRHPTMAFLSRHYDDIDWLPDSHALVFPAGGPALYLYPASSPAPDWAQPYLSAGGPPEIVTTTGGRELFRVYRLDEPPALAASDVTNFGGVLMLAEPALSPAAAGESLPVTLHWTVTTAPPPNFASVTFAHLEDLNGQRWSQVDQDAYPVAQWRPGDIILERLLLPVPSGAPPGENGVYRLRLGRFDPGSGKRVSLLDAAGGFAGDALRHDDVVIRAGPPPAPLPRPPVPVGEVATDGLRFLGYERTATTAETGEPLALALWWAAEAGDGAATLPFLTLRLALSSRPAGTHEMLRGQPAYNTYPFHTWSLPAFVIDRQVIRVPDDLEAGDYTLRLELLGAQGEPIYGADLGPLAVVETERLFTPPPVTAPIGASFGGEIALLGYNRSEGEGGPLLELVWQAESQPGDDYTVFVHVLRADGTCCLWQADAMPRGNVYPTSRWRPGEVVVDPYTIVLPVGLPPGTYPVEVGLYRAETGERLPALVAGGPVVDAVPLAPIEKAN